MSEIAREAEVCDHCGTDERTLGQLTRRAEAAERERDLATGQILMVGSEIGGDPKLDPMDYRDPRWTPTLEEAAKLRAEAERLRGALEGLMLSRDASWTGGHDWQEALEAAAAALAGEGEAPSCTWTMDEDGVWHTGCGASWIYIPGGTPDEHGQRFCHACGKSIAAAAGLDDEGRPSP